MGLSKIETEEIDGQQVEWRKGPKQGFSREFWAAVICKKLEAGIAPKVTQARMNVKSNNFNIKIFQRFPFLFKKEVELYRLIKGRKGQVAADAL